MSTSDTPRTDAEAFETDYPNSRECVDADFARELERDLTRLTAANKALVEALEKAGRCIGVRNVEHGDYRRCPICRGENGFHNETCYIGQALLLSAQTTQDKGTM